MRVDAFDFAAGAPESTGFEVVQVAAGINHVLILLANGSVYAYGRNSHGQLGLGDTSTREMPTRVPLPAGVVATGVAVGAFHSLMLTSDGRVFACGCNTHVRFCWHSV